MRFNKSILIASLFGSVVMYVFLGAIQMATPLGMVGMSELAGDGSVLPPITINTDNRAGLYRFPSQPKGDNGYKEFEEKLRQWPSGFIVYNPAPNTPVSARELIVEFVDEWIEAFLAAFLLAQTALSVWKMRVAFVAVLGFLASMATNLAYMNWYGFPLAYTATQIALGTVGFALAGAVMANLIRVPTAK